MKKTNIFFKELLTLVALFISISSVSAYTTVKSLAEIKQMSDGALIIFEGEAMTTMHLSRNNSPVPGIFIQDSNGDALFLKHQYFMATNTWFEDPTYNGYKMNQGGTIVKSFSGKFRKATTTMPAHIEFTDEDMDYIESGSTGNPIPYKTLTVDELLTNPEKYENNVIKITSDVTKKGSGLYATTFSFVNATNEMNIHLSAQLEGRQFPAGGTFYGICDKYAGKYQFLILDRYHIEPTAFFNIVDLYNFVDDKNKQAISNVELEIKEAALVNYFASMPMNKNYYIQSTCNGQTSALCVSLASRTNALGINAGDSIKGLKGFYSKLAVEDGLYKGSMFRIQEANFDNIQVINSGNNINWQEQKVYNILQTPSMFESRLLSLPVGTFKNIKFIEDGVEVERIAFVQFDGDLRKQYDTIRVQMAGGKDLTPYLEQQYAIIGILDLSEAIAAGYPTILIRDENDLVGDLEFESIGAMLAAGKPLSTKVTYTIKNPVLVTYKYFSANQMGDNEHMCGLYLQDATGAILYKTGQEVEGVVAGDSITGVKGSLQYEENIPGRQEHYLKAQATTPLTVKNSGNKLLPTTVTLDKIVNDPMKYASHLVKIENLETTVKFGFSQGYPYETKFIYQDGSTMAVTWKNLYENMSVVGVVEYGIMGHGLTIFPIEVKNTTKAFDGTCSRIKDIKNLTSGTEFTYVGNATTTFTDYENGILIQDYTGGILLKNTKLGDKGTAKIKSGMQITNIKGKYIPASGDILASIEIADTDIDNITIKNTNTSFECKVTDVNVLKYFYGKYYVGEALALRGQEISTNEDGTYSLYFRYYESGSEVETVVELPAIAKGNIDITKGELIGYARKFNGVLTFVIVGDEIPEKPVKVEDATISHDIFMNTYGELFAPEATAITIFDIKGRVVATAETSYLNLSSLTKGIYLVRSIYEDGTTQITKIVK